ncbi:MAG: STAS domain-containing protein [Anaerolineae bacterium]|nr:STAS domain-containing protein [Anaerolineae bacterium]
MQVESEAMQNVQVVRLKGRFDAFEVPAFTDWVERHVKPSHAQVVVNLEGVEFIDSSGLAALVKGLKRCREYNGNFVLCYIQQPVLIILELTRLDKAFTFYEDETSALEALSA